MTIKGGWEIYLQGTDWCAKLESRAGGITEGVILSASTKQSLEQKMDEYDNRPK